MELRLISFGLCPFVQRAVIILNEKGVRPDVEYVDLSAKPAWFLELSPRGKVPVLVADGTPLFESQAICEFLEEVHSEPRLMPSDPVARARDRAWFAFASEELFMPMYRLEATSDGDAAKEAWSKLAEKLDRLEGEMEHRAFLSGDGSAFGMADVAMAPFVYRAQRFRDRGWLDMFERRPNLDGWRGRIVTRDSVKRSVPDDWEARALAAQEARGAWVLAHHHRLTSS